MGCLCRCMIMADVCHQGGSGGTWNGAERCGGSSGQLLLDSGACRGASELDAAEKGVALRVHHRRELCAQRGVPPRRERLVEPREQAAAIGDALAGQHGAEGVQPQPVDVARRDAWRGGCGRGALLGACRALRLPLLPRLCVQPAPDAHKAVRHGGQHRRDGGHGVTGVSRGAARQGGQVEVELHGGEREGLVDVDAHRGGAVQPGVQQQGVAFGPHVQREARQQLGGGPRVQRQRHRAAQVAGGQARVVRLQLQRVSVDKKPAPAHKAAAALLHQLVARQQRALQPHVEV
mmetsp:Transcript_48101/g.121408  ORF Transcript_48101/g.121408 Transcript_48101/m.121408 type:complete len:291 (+) Transcript_48101:319-1191(+)